MSSSPPLSDSESFSRKGYDYLLKRLLNGECQPGDEINRKGIAEELGVSLAPINEAISQLEMEGFLEVTPRRQTRVRLIRREEIRGLLIMREAIECQAARLYCGAPVIADLKGLSKLAKAVDGSKPATGENERAELEFHGALINICAVPLLSIEFNKIMRRRLFHKINALAPWQEQPPMDSHTELLEQLQTKNADRAEASIRRHLQRGREEMMAL